MIKMRRPSLSVDLAAFWAIVHAIPQPQPVYVWADAMLTSGLDPVAQEQ